MRYVSVSLPYGTMFRISCSETHILILVRIDSISEKLWNVTRSLKTKYKKKPTNEKKTRDKLKNPKKNESLLLLLFYVY